MDVERQLSIPKRSHLPSCYQRVKSWEQTGLWLLSTASNRLAELIEQSAEKYELAPLSKKVFAEGIWADAGGLYRVGTLHFELQVSRGLVERGQQFIQEFTSFYRELFSSNGFALQGKLLIAQE